MFISITQTFKIINNSVILKEYHPLIMPPNASTGIYYQRIVNFSNDIYECIGTMGHPSYGLDKQGTAVVL